ncbi:TonB family protein [Erythrobacter vulgaris]|uniref:TonB family protein n=1 Tax=Qipengyuania vulgaris TaxID=291985 RepID=A0A844XQS8_9SPHN|nr:TonB family protein [Qipengyuania vulgaris]MXO47607.1 TonB family protein [Qipengyuania vulgaris]
MYKILALALATTVSAALLAEPVLSQSIVVTPDVSHQEFVEKVTRDLDRQLDRTNVFASQPSGEGISIVRFTRASDGSVSNVKIYRESGKRAFDRIAMRAVSRLRSLETLPAGVRPDQLYQANIIFAEDGWGIHDMEQQLAAEESARRASNLSERKVFAFGSAASHPTS